MHISQTLIALLSSQYSSCNDNVDENGMSLRLHEAATRRWQRGVGWKNIETQRAQSVGVCRLVLENRRLRVFE